MTPEAARITFCATERGETEIQALVDQAYYLCQYAQDRGCRCEDDRLTAPAQNGQSAFYLASWSRCSTFDLETQTTTSYHRLALAFGPTPTLRLEGWPAFGDYYAIPPARGTALLLELTHTTSGPTPQTTLNWLRLVNRTGSSFSFPEDYQASLVSRLDTDQRRVTYYFGATSNLTQEGAAETRSRLDAALERLPQTTPYLV